MLVNTNTNLSKDERTILDDVFDASETIVAEVMRPRADVVFSRRRPDAGGGRRLRTRDALLPIPGDRQGLRRRARFRARARPARRA